MTNFWKNNSKPLFVLAPMEDVTDTSFREIVAGISAKGSLNILYTEFTSIDGMNHQVGKIRVGERLFVSESERKLLNEKDIKIVAQIWGNKPELFHKISREISDEFDFDGIDINMGCPVKNIVKNGCCSALIDQPALAKEIILATKEGTSLPVSVKTRTGIKTHNTEKWLAEVFETKPDAVILHGRTQKQQSDGFADWNEIEKGAILRNKLSPDTAFLGNGDVNSYFQGLEYCETYKVDGVMIGRGIFSNPWFFNEIPVFPDRNEKLNQLLMHTRIFENNWNGKKNLNILKRFYKIYTQGFEGAAKLRAELMELTSFEEVYALVERQIKNSG